MRTVVNKHLLLLKEPPKNLEWGRGWGGKGGAIAGVISEGATVSRLSDPNTSLARFLNWKYECMKCNKNKVLSLICIFYETRQ